MWSRPSVVRVCSRWECPPDVRPGWMCGRPEAVGAASRCGRAEAVGAGPRCGRPAAVRLGSTWTSPSTSARPCPAPWHHQMTGHLALVRAGPLVVTGSPRRARSGWVPGSFAPLPGLHRLPKPLPANQPCPRVRSAPPPGSPSYRATDDRPMARSRPPDRNAGPPGPPHRHGEIGSPTRGYLLDGCGAGPPSAPPRWCWRRALMSGVAVGGRAAGYRPTWATAGTWPGGSGGTGRRRRGDGVGRRGSWLLLEVEQLDALGEVVLDRR
jgi:hypothetical protein